MATTTAEIATPGWQDTVRKKREALSALLPNSWQLESPPSPDAVPSGLALARKALTSREIEITEHYTASKLLSLLADGSLSAVEVTEAFCHRATIAHQLVC